MSIQINYKNSGPKKPSANLVLFTDDKFNIGNLKKYISNSEFSYINDLLKTSDLKKKLLVFEINSKKKIILISIKKNLKTTDVENLGAEFYSYIKSGNTGEFTINADSLKSEIEDSEGYFLHGGVFLSVMIPLSLVQTLTDSFFQLAVWTIFYFGIT